MSYPIPQPEQPGQSVLASMFEYNAWANLKLLGFCAGLSDEQLDSTTVGVFGTIRATLRHIVYSEVNYASRVIHREPENLPERDKFSGFEVLDSAVRWANDELLKLSVAATSSTMVVESRPEGTLKYKLADLMTQATSHAMEHRTQICSVITSLGLEPPDLSTWAWMDERGALEETLLDQSEPAK